MMEFVSTILPEMGKPSRNARKTQPLVRRVPLLPLVDARLVARRTAKVELGQEFRRHRGDVAALALAVLAPEAGPVADEHVGRGRQAERQRPALVEQQAG